MFKPNRYRTLLELRNDVENIVKETTPSGNGFDVKQLKESINNIKIENKPIENNKKNTIPEFRKRNDTHLNKSNIRLVL